VAEKRTFQIQLEGLIQLLAQNLYADPDVFLREMIQNAHDSIVRRAELARARGAAEPPPARIQVATDPDAEEIYIIDNGSGLTEEEIDGYLSTIGRSGTDELRQRIVAADRGRTVELIGQFGIGLLSAFIVADRVSVDTRAAGGQALRWESHGNGDYTVRPGQRVQVGTTVTLHVAPAHSRYLDRARLESIIRTYADFIGMPVFVNDDDEPANAVLAPWHRAYPSERERHTAHRDFWARKFTGENSLHVVAVDETFQWRDASRPGGTGNGRIRGVLAITDRRTPDVNARGTVDVYVNRMFISAANREVLPPWAKFVQGVVECGELTPNAARDNVVRGAALAAAQRALGALIVRELTQLSWHDRRRFTEIMRWHSYHVLAMAVQPEHEAFFRAVADLMPLDSDQGPITLPDYLETATAEDDGARLVHFISEQDSANQYFLLAGARGIRVLDCTEMFAERFLERYAETWPERVRLRRIDMAGAETIFESLEPDEARRFAELEAAYDRILPDRRYTARASRFYPDVLPAVLTETRDSKNRRDMANVADDLRVPEFIRDIVQDYLAEEGEPLTLHLNATNPTIQKLAARPDLRDEVSVQALTSLYNNAMMLLARTLPVESVRVMFNQYNQVIELMLSLAEQAARSGRDAAERDTSSADAPGLDPYVSCCVAMPSGDPRATEIYDAIRTVLESPPYFWRVVRAGEDTGARVSWPDRKHRLLAAHLHIAVLTGDAVPGMMLEIGRMEALERPLLILRDVAVPEESTALRDLPHEDLKSSGETLVGEVAEALSRHAELRALMGRDRFLSETVLTKDTGIGSDAARRISERYQAWGEFLRTDSTTIAGEAGVSRYLVEAVKETLTALGQD
jgi:molecular chaperone HtpG